MTEIVQITDNDLITIEEWAKLGIYKYTQIAAGIGISIVQLKTLRDEDSRIEEAINRGMALNKKFLHSNLMLKVKSKDDNISLNATKWALEHLHKEGKNNGLDITSSDGALKPHKPVEADMTIEQATRIYMENMRPDASD